MSAVTAWAVEVAIMGAIAAGFTYPVVAYSQNVLYREGVLLLVAALAFLVTGSFLEVVADVFGGGPGVEVAAYVFYAVSGVVSVPATWQFAREFVDFRGDDGVTVKSEEFVGGFDDDR